MCLIWGGWCAWSGGGGCVCVWSGGGVPGLGGYLVRGCVSGWGGGVPGPGDAWSRGGVSGLVGGVSGPGGVCTWSGGVCLSALRDTTPPCEQNDKQV